jgi:hypothetical protein
VSIDIALIDEDEVTRRAVPDIDHNARILRASSPSAPATSRPATPSRGAFAGSVTAFSTRGGRLHRTCRRLIAFIREEV